MCVEKFIVWVITACEWVRLNAFTTKELTRRHLSSQMWLGVTLFPSRFIFRTSSNQRLGSAFYIMCSVMIEKWVV